MGAGCEACIGEGIRRRRCDNKTVPFVQRSRMLQKQQFARVRTIACVATEGINAQTVLNLAGKGYVFLNIVPNQFTKHRHCNQNRHFEGALH